MPKVPDLSIGDTITAKTRKTTIRGEVNRIDTYPPTTNVERVVTIQISDSNDWAYLIEEPDGEYRINLIHPNAPTDNLGPVTQFSLANED